MFKNYIFNYIGKIYKHRIEYICTKNSGKKIYDIYN